MMNELSAVLFKALCGQRSDGKYLPEFIFNVPDEFKRLLIENMVKGDCSGGSGKHLSGVQTEELQVRVEVQPSDKRTLNPVVATRGQALDWVSSEQEDLRHRHVHGAQQDKACPQSQA